MIVVTSSNSLYDLGAMLFTLLTAFLRSHHAPIIELHTGSVSLRMFPMFIQEPSGEVGSGDLTFPPRMIFLSEKLGIMKTFFKA